MSGASPPAVAAAPGQLEHRGDLFAGTADDTSIGLVHCVSRSFRMGAGIAVAFRVMFGRVDELQRQNVPIGGVAHLQHTDGRHVFYLVTKENHWDKPTLHAIQQALYALFDKAGALGVRRIAMPRLGCGLDGRKWRTEVLPLLDKARRRAAVQGIRVACRVYTGDMDPGKRAET